MALFQQDETGEEFTRLSAHERYDALPAGERPNDGQLVGGRTARFGMFASTVFFVFAVLALLATFEVGPAMVGVAFSLFAFGLLLRLASAAVLLLHETVRVIESK